jgi:6-phosphogluconate dehydrogenase
MVNIIKIAIIGCGSMGGNMALLFAENGLHVSLSDPAEETMDGIIEKAEKAGYHNRVAKFKGTCSPCFN